MFWAVASNASLFLTGYRRGYFFFIINGSIYFFTVWDFLPFLPGKNYGPYLACFASFRFCFFRSFYAFCILLYSFYSLFCGFNCFYSILLNSSSSTTTSSSQIWPLWTGAGIFIIIYWMGLDMVFISFLILSHSYPLR